MRFISGAIAALSACCSLFGAPAADPSRLKILVLRQDDHQPVNNALITWKSEIGFHWRVTDSNGEALVQLDQDGQRFIVVEPKWDFRLDWNEGPVDPQNTVIMLPTKQLIAR